MTIEPGNGSGLQIHLPRLDGAKTPRAKAAAPLAPVPVRILFVDDDPPVVEVAVTLLEHLGYLVTALTSSIEAWQVFRGDPQGFDLVITDLSMPLMSGLELAAELVELRPDVPIILCSGDSDPISPETAQQLGIREFLTKPANIVELTKAIRRALDYEKQ
ncbi:MAG: response regulator [Thermodesulfobacteriota bacterium]